MNTAWYAMMLYAPLVGWALIERAGRKGAESDRQYLREHRDHYKQEARDAEDRVGELRERYGALAAEQNGTKRRALKAERSLRALEAAAMRPERAPVPAVDKGAEAQAGATDFPVDPSQGKC